METQGQSYLSLRGKKSNFNKKEMKVISAVSGRRRRKRERRGGHVLELNCQECQSARSLLPSCPRSTPDKDNEHF